MLVAAGQIASSASVQTFAIVFPAMVVFQVWYKDNEIVFAQDAATAAKAEAQAKRAQTTTY